MVSFRPGCVVVHRPTECLFRVLQWTAEDAVMLLQPLMLADDNQNSKGEPMVRREQLAGTRWAFEKDVVLIEKPTPTTRAARGKNKKKCGPTSATSNDTGKGHADNSHAPVAVAAEEKPRQLDARFVVRRDPLRPKRGRGVFAVHGVPAGTEVMRVRAVAVAAKFKYHLTVCAYCFTNQRPQKDGGKVLTIMCDGCNARLCEECYARPGVQDSARAKVHADTCQFTKSVAAAHIAAHVDSELLVLVADCLARRKRGLIDDQEWAAINGLESSEIGMAGGVKDLLGERDLRAVRERMEELLPTLGIILESDIQTIYSRMSRNTHPFHNQDPVFISPNATGLFPTAALVNHSCDPNACFHSTIAESRNNGQVEIEIEFVLRTMREVAAGEEVCLSYISHPASKVLADRRDLLKAAWGFRCECSRCIEETMTYSRPKLSPADEQAIILERKVSHYGEKLNRQLIARWISKNGSSAGGTTHKQGGGGGAIAAAFQNPTDVVNERDRIEYLSVMDDVIRFLSDEKVSHVCSKHRKLHLAVVMFQISRTVVDEGDPTKTCAATASMVRVVDEAGLNDTWIIRLLLEQRNLLVHMASLGDLDVEAKSCHRARSLECLCDAISYSALYFGQQHPFTKKLERVNTNQHRTALQR